MDELAVRERALDILREGKSDWCDINHWNFGSCGHCDKNEAECKAYKVDHALAQARAELEPKPEALRDEKPEVKP